MQQTPTHQDDQGGLDPDRDDELRAGKGKMQMSAEDQGDMSDQADTGAGRDASHLERLVRWKRETWDGKPRPPMEVKVGPARSPGEAKRTAVQLSASPLPGAAALFGAAGAAPREAKPLLQAFASLLMAAAHRPAAPGVPATASLALAAAQAHLQRQPADSPSLSLAEVKLLLIEVTDKLRNTPGRPPRDDGEAAQNARLLLPIQVLNATRPRTPPQRDTAVMRLQLTRTTRGLG